MYGNKKMLLAAGLIAGAAMMTGCAADMRNMPTPSPQAQKVTAQPAQAQEQTPQPTMDAASEEESASLPLEIEGEEAKPDAVREQGKTLLPLVATAKALGWKVENEESESETEKKRVMTLEKEESRITISWTVSDNTARSITWQKDGLLIPVDPMITTIEEHVYVPSAFFEEAMDAEVNETQNGVSVSMRKPLNTPETDAQQLEGNG